jgi:hypothetical protein
VLPIRHQVLKAVEQNMEDDLGSAKVLVVGILVWIGIGAVARKDMQDSLCTSLPPLVFHGLRALKVLLNPQLFSDCSFVFSIIVALRNSDFLSSTFRFD